MTAVPIPSPESDGELLNRSVLGDRGALDELFRRYRQPAFRVAFRLLGQEADALDAVQEAFIKVLTHLEDFQGRSSFKTWLLRIVSNAALDVGRKKARRSTQSADLGDEGDADPNLLAWNDPSRGLDNADLRKALDGALATLSDAQKETFVLHVEGDMSYQEVADALGISIGTVMSRLFYARQRLKTELTEYVMP
jgi:RNA polymerase sigma-70 factor, ECF subfamily